MMTESKAWKYFAAHIFASPLVAWDEAMNRFQVPEIAPQEAGETQRLASRGLVEKLGVGRFQQL